MADDQLARAKTLIRQRRYQEARALLASIDHPTARRWLSRLDEQEKIDPVRSEGLMAALVVAAIVLVIGGGFALARVIGWI